MTLRGSIECAESTRDRLHIAAEVGDLAVARMLNSNFDERFVVGVVAEVGERGGVTRIATTRTRTSWQFGSQVHVGKREKLGSLTAEQLALQFPASFKTFEDVHRAVVDAVTSWAGRAQGEREP